MALWNYSCAQCHSTAWKARPNARSGANAGGMSTATAELGISCEACHGPGHKHAVHHQNPVNRLRQRRSTTADPYIFNPKNAHARRSSESCGQCHGSAFHRDDLRKIWHEGLSFRPGDVLAQSKIMIDPTDPAQARQIAMEKRRDAVFVESTFWRDGVVRVSGRDFSNMRASACYKSGKLSCLSCHSMHDSEPADMLRRDLQGDAACMQCHEHEIKDVQAHTHHPTSSSGSRCNNCHMPHTTYGLLKAIRSHTISSPSVIADDLRAGRPNACNLCHLDKTLAWTNDHLQEWYKQPKANLSQQQQTIATGVTWILKGDGGERALASWHFGREESRAAAGTNWMAPFLITMLDDPYHAVRYIGEQSLRSLPEFIDQPFEYDRYAASPKRRRLGQKLMLIWEQGNFRPQGDSILFPKAGQLDRQAFRQIFRQRNNRVMDLRE